MLKATTHALTDVRKFLTSGSGCVQSPPFRRPRDQKKRGLWGREWRYLCPALVLGNVDSENEIGSSGGPVFIAHA